MSWLKRGEDGGAAESARAPEPSDGDRLAAQVRAFDEERQAALSVLRVLKPGVEPRTLAAELMACCRGPFDLATFYLALVDYEEDQLTFPFYSEGGKARNIPPSSFSGFKGLTAHVVSNRAPIYHPDRESQERVGVVYTEAERLTGLIPETWYGLPLGLGPGWPERPFGVLSFQSFRKDAFSPARRETMDAMGAALALALKADPGRALPFG